MPQPKPEYDDKRFRTLIEQSTDAIQLINRDGDIVYSSDSVKNVLGYTPREIQNAEVVPYVHPDDLKKYTEAWHQLLEKPKSQAALEYRVKHKNGEWVWLETRATNHLDTPGIEAVVGNFRNITRRKNIEAQLRESEDQNRRLVDLSPEAIVVHAEGRLQYVNQAGADLIGAASTDELIGQPIAKFVHPDYMQIVQERVVQLLNNQVPTDLQHEKFIRLNGDVIDVEVISIPFTYNGMKAIQVVIRDITERERFVSALREREERLRFMAETMPQKMFTATPSGEVDYFNPQWTEYTGLSDDKLYKWGWTACIHPDDLAPSLNAWKKSISTGKSFAIEQRFLRHDGAYRWHITRAAAMRGPDLEIVRWFGSNTDIHDIKTAMKREHDLEKKTLKLTEQRTQLVALNNAKDEFISLASHQLRTPATAVKQYLGMALQGYVGELSDEQREMIALADASNERQISIINDLLEVARVDAGKIDLDKTQVRIAELVREVIDEQASVFKERNQIVTLRAVNTGLALLIDRPRIRMVLENLINNASKYTPHGKSITITVERDKDSVCVAVSDEGVGIDPDNIDRLFRKFSRLDNPLSVLVGGSGLGLYWAKKIVDAHHGTIEVSSELSIGSTFTMKLPHKVRKVNV